jgi:hypothetical protein
MPSIETVIVAVSLASMLAVVGGTAAILHQLSRAGQPRRARYHGRHWATLPPRPGLLAAALHGWRDLAHAHALLRGDPLW